MAEARRIRLGELLVDAGLLPPADPERVPLPQKNGRGRLSVGGLGRRRVLGGDP